MPTTNRRSPAQSVPYDSLDPGIREVVRKVNKAGFVTSDSGDGVSKPADLYAGGYAIPVPHVVARSTPARLVKDTDRLALVLGPTWVVEGTYKQGTAILFACKAKR